VDLCGGGISLVKPGPAAAGDYRAKMLGKNQVVVLEDTTEQLEAETRKLSHFLSLFDSESWARKLSVRRRETGPLREIAGKRSDQRIS